VSDCAHVEIPNEGDKNPPLSFFLERFSRGSEEEKIIPRSEAFRHCFLLILRSSELGRAGQSGLFFAAATTSRRRLAE
jgi:hypothetical protein